MLIPLGFLAGSGGGVGTDYELIETVVLGSAQPSITFSNLNTYSSTYKHFQIRSTHAWTSSGATDLAMRLNADTGTNYDWHSLRGNGSSVDSIAGTNTNYIRLGFVADTTFGGSVTDILDAYSSSKNKTVRTLVGNSGGGFTGINLSSGAWRNTNSITSVTILTGSNNFATGSRFSLYGIKG